MEREKEADRWRERRKLTDGERKKLTDGEREGS